MASSMRFGPVLAGGVVAILVGAFLAGCGEPVVEAPASPPAGGGGGAVANPVPEVALPADLVLTKAPEGARGVGEIKATAKEGDEVVLRGKVGGTLKPFVAGRAAMVVADLEKARSCEKMPDDACKTPWDYCCESKEVLTANTATLQVADAEGRPLKVSLEGKGGVKPLSIVVVKGRVGPRPDPGVLVVNVTGMFVEP